MDGLYFTCSQVFSCNEINLSGVLRDTKRQLVISKVEIPVTFSQPALGTALLIMMNSATYIHLLGLLS